MTARHPYSTIADWRGEGLSESMIDRIATSPLYQILIFAEEYLRQSFQNRPPANQPGRLQPYCRQQSVMNYWRYGWPEAPSGLYRPRAGYYRDQALPMVRKASLYAHHVVIDDPFGMLLWGLVLGDVTDSMPHDGWRQDISNSLNFLLSIKPLAEVGALTASMWFEMILDDRFGESIELPFEVNNKLQELAEPKVAMFLFGKWGIGPKNSWRLYRRRELDFPIDYIRSLNLNPEDFTVTQRGCKAQQVANELPGSITPLLPDDLSYRLFTWWLQMQHIRGVGDSGQLDLQRLAALSKLDNLPTVSRLAQLRSNSESFAEWRNSLRTGLMAVSELSINEENWLAAARNIMHDCLEAPHLRLAKELRRSSLVQAGRGAAFSFGISALGYFASVAAGGPTVADMVADGSSIAADAIAGYIKGLHDRRSGQALLEHYVALSGD